jgi:hypothetical protein
VRIHNTILTLFNVLIVYLLFFCQRQNAGPKSKYQEQGNNRNVTSDRNRPSATGRQHHPEWMMDDEEEAMTFDHSGKFVSVKVIQKNLRLI